jgi:outer membrane protein assembly factor BamB
LLLIKANPEKFEVLEKRKISEQETWAHLAVVDGQMVIREQNALAVWEWK